MDSWLPLVPSSLTRLVTPSRIAAIALVATSAGSVGWLVRERHDAGRVHLLSDSRLPTSDLALMEAAFNRAKLTDYVVEEGRILVPKTRQSDYVRALVDAQALPKEFGGSLRRALERNSPWQSRATQAELLRVAMQEELSLVLCSMPGIRRASVLVDTEESAGGRAATEKTASVSVETEEDAALEPQRVRAIRVLVAASIAGLPAERVAVTDLRTGLVFTGPLAEEHPSRAAVTPAPSGTAAAPADGVSKPEPPRRAAIAALPPQPSARAGANAPAELEVTPPVPDGSPPAPEPPSSPPLPPATTVEGGPNLSGEPRETDAAARRRPAWLGGPVWLCVAALPPPLRTRGRRVHRRHPRAGTNRSRGRLGRSILASIAAGAGLGIAVAIAADPPLAAVNASAEVAVANPEPVRPSRPADDDALPGLQPPGREPSRATAPPTAVPPSPSATGAPPMLQEASPERLFEFFFSGRSGGASLTAALVFGVASLAPAVLLMATSFVRMSVVLSLVRQGLGAGGIPSNQIVTSLALFLTALVMWPVWKDCWQQGVEPLAAGHLQPAQAFEQGARPLRKWMRSQIDAAGNGETLTYFATLSPREPRGPEVSTAPSISPDRADGLEILLPAFLVSELKMAFAIGLKLLVPFLAIDVMAAVVVAAAGLPTLSPTTVGLPLKLLVFVVADGWTLVVRSLVGGYLAA